MAYRKAPSKKTARRASGGYGKGNSSGNFRGKRTARARRTSSSANGGLHTVRIVIEQPGSSDIARPSGEGRVVTPRKSPF